MSFKVKNILYALIYSIAFYFCYINFLNTYFEYANFPLYTIRVELLILSFIISVAPISLYKGFNSISSFIAVFIYILLYVPTIITFSLALNESFWSIIAIQIIFFISMCIIFLANNTVLFNTPKKIKKYFSFKFILILTIICSFYPLYIYWGHLQFVSLVDVYDQRSANLEIGTDVVSRYLTTWLSSLLIPLCLLYGILSKKYSYFILGTLSSIILYMATASKGTILMPVFLIGLNYLLTKFGKENIFSSFIIVLSSFMGAFLLLIKDAESIFFVPAALLIWRIVGVGGQLNMLYYDFFLTHPKTYYSHIGPINSLTNWYPYGSDAIGQVIGKYYFSEDMSANANFWATDGLASFGLIGVIIISIIFYFFLILINSITQKYDKVFLVLLFLPFLYTLLNVSLFQSMWSGGGFFILTILLFLKTDNIRIIKT